MYFNEPGNPTRLKQAVYLAASTILGVFLIVIVNTIIEINYLSFDLSQEQGSVLYYGVLPPAYYYEFLLLGAAGGFFLGQYWWRLVYVERAWAKKNGRKK